MFINPTPEMDFVCEKCRSRDVTAEGTLRWDVAYQRWVSDNADGAAYCQNYDCDTFGESETNLITIEVSTKREIRYISVTGHIQPQKGGWVYTDDAPDVIDRVKRANRIIENALAELGL